MTEPEAGADRLGDFIESALGLKLDDWQKTLLANSTLGRRVTLRAPRPRLGDWAIDAEVYRQRVRAARRSRSPTGPNDPA